MFRTNNRQSHTIEHHHDSYLEVHFESHLESHDFTGQTQDALFERVHLFQRFGFSKGTPSILQFFGFGNSKLDINR